MDNINMAPALDFSVSIYGAVEQFTDTISKGRVKIFYKYGNRNRSWITDEFADALLSSLPYTPIKGIYSESDGDFTDHGHQNAEGRIYGIVPAEPNVGWEKFVDEDGIEREYACADVLLYTALYKEANEILTKGESMELYPPSIKGTWRRMDDGQDYYVFESGSFFGLQVLGDTVEPCFEGAAFFSLYESLKDIVNVMEAKGLNVPNYTIGQGDTNMFSVAFKLSDDDKRRAIFKSLNPNCNEQGGWVMNYEIINVYDEYAVAYSYEEDKYYRVRYTKNEDTVEIGDKEECFIIDVSADELAVLKTFNETHDSYTVISDYDTQVAQVAELTEVNANLSQTNAELATTNENLTVENQNFSTKIAEYEDTLTTLKSEKSAIETQFTALSTEHEELVANYETIKTDKAAVEAECATLRAYKKDVEDTAKRDLIATYSTVLADEVLDQYRNELDNYSLQELDMRLTYAQKQTHPETFSLSGQVPYVPVDSGRKGGIEDILSRYEKK